MFMFRMSPVQNLFFFLRIDPGNKKNTSVSHGDMCQTLKNVPAALMHPTHPNAQ